MYKYNLICKHCNKKFIGIRSKQLFCIECSFIKVECSSSYAGIFS